MSGIEVDVLLKSQEHHLLTVMEQIDTKIEECLKRHSGSFNREVKDLRAVAKEWHILLVDAVKKVKEDVNFKVNKIILIFIRRLI